VPQAPATEPGAAREGDDRMKIERLDHLVLTVRSIEATVEFYVRVLGMQAVSFGGGRRALAFGQQKINLHPAEAPFRPSAERPTPGSADLCFIASVPISEVVAHLREAGVVLDAGPVPRTGALGPMTSVYVRDPDGNLIEVSRYD